MTVKILTLCGKSQTKEYLVADSIYIKHSKMKIYSGSRSLVTSRHGEQGVMGITKVSKDLLLMTVHYLEYGDSFLDPV